jgi:F-type H+-transporting ATPase subunit b
MQETLNALGGILLKAIPTVCLLIIVHFYLKWMFFRPVREMLEKRREVTEGARESAAVALKQANEKAGALEAALRKARDEIYQEQEETRRRWIVEQASRLDEARHQSREVIHQAKQELEVEAATARRTLAATADGLAEEIVGSLLGRRAS